MEVTAPNSMSCTVPWKWGHLTSWRAVVAAECASVHSLDDEGENAAENAAATAAGKPKPKAAALNERQVLDLYSNWCVLRGG